MKTVKKVIIGCSLLLAAASTTVVTVNLATGGDALQTHTLEAVGDFYGIEEGNIVRLNLNEPQNRTETIYESGSVNQAQRTDNYFVYTTKSSEFMKLDASNMSSVTQIEQETPEYSSMAPLTEDLIFYGVARNKPVGAHEEHDHQDEETHATGRDAAHDIFYLEGRILDLSGEKELKIISDLAGSEVLIDSVDVSPSGKQLLISDIGGAAYLYDNEGNLIEDLNLEVSKSGFLNEDTLWYTDALDQAGKTGNEMKLFDLDTQETTALDKNVFSKMSVLDIKPVGEHYIFIGNDYESGSPKQTIFKADRELTSLEGIVNLTSISLNSNGKVFPINDEEFLVDVRSSVHADELATLRLSTGDYASTLSGVYNIFSQ